MDPINPEFINALSPELLEPKVYAAQLAKDLGILTLLGMPTNSEEAVEEYSIKPVTQKMINLYAKQEINRSKSTSYNGQSTEDPYSLIENSQEPESPIKRLENTGVDSGFYMSDSDQTESYATIVSDPASSEALDPPSTSPVSSQTDTSRIVEEAANDPYFTSEYRRRFRSGSPRHADRARTGRFRLIEGIDAIADKIKVGWKNRVYLTPSRRQETFYGTQLEGELHRRLTPRFREIFADTELREDLMSGIDESALLNTSQLYESLTTAKELGEEVFYDIVIVGSGVHGSAAAAHAREQYPDAKILLMDSDDQLGGQFRGYGPNPAFRINSRNRRESRFQAGVPRTPGNINSMGPFATLQPPDVAPANEEYIDNTLLGDVAAVNGFLAATDTAVRTRYRSERRNSDDSFTVQLSIKPNESVKEQRFAIRTAAVIKAFGESQESALGKNIGTKEQGFFNRKAFYEHFGNKQRIANYVPMKAFDDKVVVVIGGGDTASTVNEALTGALPKKTYGKYSGYERPKQIVWIGAPGEDAFTVQDCLRNRYRQNIGPALPKREGDQGALILPVIQSRASSVVANEGGGWIVEYTDKDGNSTRLAADVVVDTTNVPKKKRRTRIKGIYIVGAGSPDPLNAAALSVVNGLGISENTLAIWARMPETLQKASMAVARVKEYALAA